MKIFLAGTWSRQWLVKGYVNESLSSRGELSPFACSDNSKPTKTDKDGGEGMKLFLAGQAPWKYEGIYDKSIQGSHPYILESFLYVNKDTERLMPYYGDFLLDSGAFTFCKTGDFSLHKVDEYLERYADFIVKNKVGKFFELDIDSITGYDKVLEYRARLEKLTGRQPIPVWHRNRGKEEFVRHCEEYPYVALGGYAAGVTAGDTKQKDYVKAFPWFIKTAHKNHAKIHGLGFTVLKGLEQYHFDSVDSTAWTTGNRFGYVYKFNGRTMEKIPVPNGKRMADSKAIALINFTEWVKFQKYADTHL